MNLRSYFGASVPPTLDLSFEELWVLEVHAERPFKRGR